MGRETRTNTAAGPPQLMPEGAEGYGQASQFYKGQLAQPSVFGGERFAEPTALQNQATKQAEGFMGGEKGPAYRTAAETEMNKTLGGEWMGGKEQQAAVQSAAQPIFERFENQVMPGIRDRAQFSGQGATGSRRGIAEGNAAQELGQSLATGVVAPMYQGERERMTRQAVEGTQGLLSQDIARIGGMQQLGETQRQLEELPVGAERDIFEEGLARKGSAAESLVAAATTGPGGSSSVYNPSTWRMILGSGKA